MTRSTSHTILRRPTRTLLIPGAAAIAVAGGLLAGCGGSSPSRSVARIGPSKSTGTSSSSSASPTAPVTSQARFAQLQKFSQCMRTHGMPSFPDPQQVAGGGVALVVHDSASIGPGKSSPQFRSASSACRKYAPAGIAGGPAATAQLRRQALAFSACMRTHGVPSFPDPKFTSGPGGHGVGVQVGGPGVNFNSPQFQSAQSACRNLIPGGGP